jgi:tRNA(Ile)-lysidine synthase
LRIEQVEESLSELEISDCRILVAASGGLDSTVLAHVLVGLARSRRLEILLAHVNHGLRGAESDGDEQAVAAFAGRHGLALQLRRVDPESLRRGTSSRARPTRQEAARSLRRGALYEMRAEVGAHYVATGHHADDQAETVLLRLLRGCSPDSLAGIPAISRDRVLIRPLLAVSRADLLAYARSAGLSWREDSSNADPRYARNRLRADWLPALARDFNPQLLRAIGNLAEAQRRDSEWLEELVAVEAARRFRCRGDCVEIASQGWKELPEALARRLVRHLLIGLGAGRDLSRANLLRVLGFLREGRRGAEIELPGGLRLGRTREVFVLRSQRPDPGGFPAEQAAPAGRSGEGGGRVLR